MAWWIGSEALGAKGVRGGVAVSHSHVALNLVRGANRSVRNVGR